MAKAYKVHGKEMSRVEQRNGKSLDEARYTKYTFKKGRKYKNMIEKREWHFVLLYNSSQQLL